MIELCGNKEAYSIIIARHTDDTFGVVFKHLHDTVFYRHSQMHSVLVRQIMLRLFPVICFFYVKMPFLDK